MSLMRLMRLMRLMSRDDLTCGSIRIYTYISRINNPNPAPAPPPQTATIRGCDSDSNQTTYLPTIPTYLPTRHPSRAEVRWGGLRWGEVKYAVGT